MSDRGNFGERGGKGSLLIRALIIYAPLTASLGYLFYRSLAASIVLMSGFPIFYREYGRIRKERMRRLLQRQFVTAMQLVTTALQTGYAVENAFRDAWKELQGIYPGDAPIMRAFLPMIRRMDLNVPAEQLLLEMGQQSDVEDILTFAEVFYTARKAGGDLIMITRNTTEGIRQKEETRAEIETVIAGKQMEQRMMCLIPLLILLYVGWTSPGFLDVMYHNLPGILVMTLSLLVYATAALWGSRIMDIRI